MEIANIVATAAMGIALGAFLIGAVLTRGFPEMQIMTALHASFLSLSTLTSVHPLTAVLFEVKLIMGYNNRNFSLGPLESVN